MHPEMTDIHQSSGQSSGGQFADLGARRQIAELHEALKGGSGGGTSGGMDSRVTALETHMEYVRRDLDQLKHGQDSIGVKLDRLGDRLSGLPTKADLNTWRWQWLAMGIAIIALTVGGITGGLALIARFAG